MPDVSGVSPAEELAALPAAELAARLAEAYRVIGELTAQAEQLAVVNERLTARVEELERQVRRDSASSSRPPVVTEYVAQAKQCPCCAAVTEGELPPFVRARASFGPETCAQAANLACGNYIPVGRAAVLLREMAGVAASTGWMAGIRGRAAALVADSGFTDRVRELLKTAPAVHADETPARAAGGMRYVHLACTAYLTHLHTGDRSADAIDAGGVLPGYRGVIVRDGYFAYGHLTDAMHAWCGAHLLRDLKDLYDFEPGRQDWASQMAALLIEARGAARDARQAGKTALDAGVLRGPGHPLPGTGHVRSRREHLPPHRDCQRRPPDRPQVPELRGHDPAVRYPPGSGHFHE